MFNLSTAEGAYLGDGIVTHNSDLLVSPDDSPRWAEAGINHLWLPPGVYGPECGIGRANRRRYPHRVVFVGSHPYPHPEWEPYRSELLARLGAHLGDAFTIWPKNRQPIRGKALADLYASAEVVVGDSCLSGETHLYFSDRVPETLGRGAFLVHPGVAGMEDWYTDGEHLRTYPLGGWENLLATVDYYLAHPDERRAIASAGAALVASRDTYRHRMDTVLDALDDQFGIPEPRPQPATVSATRERPLPRAGARTNGATRPNGMLLGNRADRTPGPALVRVRHRGRGMPASFETTGGDSAVVALKEVWDDDTYGMEASHVYRRVCLDIGANCGAWSVLAARMGAAAVHAYEPHPETYAVLVRNLERNGIAAKVTPHPAAVLGRARSAVLVGVGGGAHIGGAGEGAAIEAVGICEAIDAAAGADGTVTIKSDCEGGELDWFAGMPDAYLERVDHLVMEWHGWATMPHLGHLNDDGRYLERWQSMVTRLADHGRLALFGHPTSGGILRFSRF